MIENLFSRLPLMLLLLAGMIPSAMLASDGAESSAPSGADVSMDVSLVKPVIEVRFNGRGPYRIIVDSGAHPPLILDEDLATELGLKRIGSRRVGDPSNPEAIEAGVVLIDSVEVGSIHVKGVEALTWDRKFYTGADRPRGIAGLDLFGDALVTFDYPAGRFRVEPGSLPEPDGRNILPAGSRHGLPTIPIEVGGQTFSAHLDTGSMGPVSLPLKAKESLSLMGEPREIGRARTANSEFAILKAPVRGTMRVGPLSIENPDVHFHPLPDANVGSEILRSMAVTFDRVDGRVRLVVNEAAAALPPRPRFGIRLSGAANGNLPVAGVEPGSLAEASGVRAGDAIVRMNGRAVSEMGPGDYSAIFRSPAFTLTVIRNGAEIEIPVRTPVPIVPARD